jgi:formiminotetrahydrofolate cyclodeaminase
MATIFDAVAREAAVQGVQIAGSEIVGLVPRRALEDAAAQYLRVENFHPESIVENRLDQVLNQKAEEPADAAKSWTNLVGEFVNAVAAPTPVPAGGSAAALAGALAAALGEMVCGVSLKRKSLAAHHAALATARAQLTELRLRLLENVDHDAESYAALILARKLPASTDAERALGEQAVEEATQQACAIPLETSELSAAVGHEVARLRAITIAQAAPDLGVAARLAETARRAGIDNVRANLTGVRDEAWLRDIAARLQALQEVDAIS